MHYLTLICGHEHTHSVSAAVKCMIQDIYIYTAYLAGNNWLSDYRMNAILAAIFIVYIS